MHYIIPSLLKEKPDIGVIHVGSNNVNHITFEHLTLDKVADKIVNIGKIYSQYGVNFVFFSIFVRNSITLCKMINKVNATDSKKCEENGCQFVRNGNILQKHLCKYGVYLTDVETNILARNTHYISHFI